MTGAVQKHCCQNWCWNVMVFTLRQSLFPLFTAQSRRAQRWQTCPIWWSKQQDKVILWQSQFWKNLRASWRERLPQSISNLGHLPFHWLSQAERFCMEYIFRKLSTTHVKLKG